MPSDSYKRGSQRSMGKGSRAAPRSLLGGPVGAAAVAARRHQNSSKLEATSRQALTGSKGKNAKDAKLRARPSTKNKKTRAPGKVSATKGTRMHRKKG
jgi:hypothetical protein